MKFSLSNKRTLPEWVLANFILLPNLILYDMYDDNGLKWTPLTPWIIEWSLSITSLLQVQLAYMYLSVFYK